MKRQAPILITGSERRYITRPIELRASEDPAVPSRTIVFYAAVYNKQSNLLSDGYERFREIIAPGAFDACLGQDTVCNVNHDDDSIVGRTTAGNLRITSDNIGLRCEVDIPNTTSGNDLLENVRVGNITQASFCFVLGPDGDIWVWTEQDGWMRTINSISRLYDVSMVVWPAYDDAGISEEDSKRSLDCAFRSLKAHIEKQNPSRGANPAELKRLQLKFRNKSTLKQS